MEQQHSGVLGLVGDNKDNPDYLQVMVVYSTIEVSSDNIIFTFGLFHTNLVRLGYVGLLHSRRETS